MAGLMDILKNLSPEQNQGLMAAAASMLQQSGPSRTPTSFGQIAVGGAQAFQQGVHSSRDRAILEEQRAMQQQFLGWKVKDAEADFGQQQANRERDGRVSKRVAGLWTGGDMPSPLEAVGFGAAGEGGAAGARIGGVMNPEGLTPASHMNGGVFTGAAARAGLPDDMVTLNKIVDGVNRGMTPDAAAAAASGRSGMQQQAGAASGTGPRSGAGGEQPAPTASEPNWFAMGMPPQMAMSMQQGQRGPRQNRTQEMVQNLMSKAQIQFEEGDLAGAEKTLDMVQKFRPNATWKEVRQGGKVVNMPFFDDGQAGEASNAEVAAKLHWEDTGPATFGLDAYDGSVKAQMRNGMTPDGAASNAVARDNLKLSRDRFGLERQKFAQEAQGAGGQKAPPGYRWSANGSSLEAIPGGPATMKANATEGERKAATLLMRLDGSEKQLQAALKDDPGASTPSLLTQGLRSMGAEATANTVTGSGRQRVEAAQLDMLDAALTLGTGAAYTREQLEGYRRSYFPQIGDSDDTVADKKDRLKNVIEAAKVAAGRAAPKQDAESPTSKPPVTLADITATARASGRTTREVTAAFRAKGYKIQGDK